MIVYSSPRCERVSETVAENAEMASRLKRIPVERVWDLLRAWTLNVPIDLNRVRRPSLRT